MKREERLDFIMAEKDGIITTSDALKLNISKTGFLDYVHRKGLRKISQGIYSSEDAWPDAFRDLQMRYPSIVFSHESALYLHDMAEREPSPISITVRSGYHASSMSKYNLKVYRTSADWIDLGLIEKESPTSYPVRCYNLERTLCDLLRSRKAVDYQELTAAFKSYVKRKDRNIPQLMRYGEVFRVTDKLKTYMEVLL